MIDYTLNYFTFDVLWFIPVLFLIIRPVSVWIGLFGTRTTAIQRNLIGWFGIRGIGSINYLMYAIAHGLPQGLAQHLATITLTVVAVSIVVHGISVTPTMNLYANHKKYLPNEHFHHSHSPRYD